MDIEHVMIRPKLSCGSHNGHAGEISSGFFVEPSPRWVATCQVQRKQASSAEKSGYANESLRKYMWWEQEKEGGHQSYRQPTQEETEKELSDRFNDASFLC
jgi:hypothetical protein